MLAKSQGMLNDKHDLYYRTPPHITEIENTNAKSKKNAYDKMLHIIREMQNTDYNYFFLYCLHFKKAKI